jgi:polyferredoxin
MSFQSGEKMIVSNKLFQISVLAAALFFSLSPVTFFADDDGFNSVDTETVTTVKSEPDAESHKAAHNSEEFTAVDQTEVKNSSDSTNSAAEDKKSDDVTILSQFVNFLYTQNGTIVMLIVFLAAAVLIRLFRLYKLRFVLLLFSLLYFGFLVGGCNCSVGAFLKLITLHHVTIGIAILAVVPLVFALIFGRIYCGYVCPFGALQEFLNVRDKSKNLSVKAEASSLYVRIFLTLLIIAAVIISGRYIVGEVFPFKTIFNFSGGTVQIVSAFALVLSSLFIYRPFCRFVCPYSIALNIVSRFSIYKFKCTEDEKCNNCSLCNRCCKLNAIDKNEIDSGRCIECGDCVESCKSNK